MRNFINNPARVIIDEAVKAVRNDVSQTPVQSAGSVVPTSGTTMGTDGDGNVYTIHALIWGIDNWGDKESVWA